MKKCAKCGEVKRVDSFRTCRLYKGMEQGSYLRSECVDCERKVANQLRKALISAPSKPDECDCCGKVSKLCPDHDHRTGLFRGWLCRNCNQGIGKLGDTKEALYRAIEYIERCVPIKVSA